MKALILAGGKGTRLRPITYTFAKQLIPVANKPILFYGLEAIAQAGIREAGIVVQAQSGPQGLEFGPAASEIRDAVGDGARFGLKVRYILQEAPLGLAHAVKIARSYLKDDPFLMYLGDNLLKEGVSDLVREFKRQRPAAQILAVKVPNPRQFGVVEVDGDDQVLHLEEKPRRPKSDLALAGVYLFDKTVFSAIADIQPSPRGELEITDAIQWLLDHRRRVLCRRVGGWWKDTGKLEDLLEANRLILEDIPLQPVSKKGVERSKIEGRVVIEPGAKVVASTVRGPVVIAAGARIEKSYIGPFTSIGQDVQVADSEIEHSILLQAASVRGVRPIQDSLIGQRVEVLRAAVRPTAYRIMAGDSSRIQIP